MAHASIELSADTLAEAIERDLALGFAPSAADCRELARLAPSLTHDGRLAAAADALVRLAESNRLGWLLLQSTMGWRGRALTMLANVVKSHHGAAENAIHNVR